MQNISKRFIFKQLIWISIDLLAPISPPKQHFMSETRERRNIMSTVTLNDTLDETSERIISPKITKWRGSNRRVKMKPFKRPYRVLSPDPVDSNAKTLNVINFQTVESGGIPLPKSPGVHTSLPKIHKLKAIKARIGKSLDQSNDELEHQALLEILESIQIESPVPMYKNQYSLGQKWIPHQKRGKMGFQTSGNSKSSVHFLRKLHASQKFSGY